ncbi:NYN domain-containing protein [Streptomyces sp. NPDC051993]|uniref:NYN domain-containing protein n=1 Tax=Streptomyces sp. NPDC051993 TaxID=3155286 RepID=UPI00343FB183
MAGRATDVNIAVALMEITASAQVDTVLVVSADSDLCPAVRSARTVNPQLTIVPTFPPHRRSGELKVLLPSAFKLRQSQLPAVVRHSVTEPNSNGRTSRPRRGKVKGAEADLACGRTDVNRQVESVRGWRRATPEVRIASSRLVGRCLGRHGIEASLDL